jgi:hypothetical protein
VPGSSVPRLHWAGAFGLKATAAHWPIGAPSLKNATVPDGCTPEVAVTVAVSVGAFGHVPAPPSLEVNVVAVPAAAMVCVRVALVDAAKLAEELE